jgi:hypothetical protein
MATFSIPRPSKIYPDLNFSKNHLATLNRPRVQLIPTDQPVEENGRGTCRSIRVHDHEKRTGEKSGRYSDAPICDADGEKNRAGTVMPRFATRTWRNSFSLVAGWPGTDVMFFFISPKNLAKKWSFLLKLKLNYAKILS